MALERNRGRRIQPGELAVVVGAGRSGLAAAKLLRREKARVRLLERNRNAIDLTTLAALQRAGVEVLFGEHTPELFENAVLVVASPGLPLAALREMMGSQAARTSCEIMAEMELAWRYLDGEPVLAVTGTSGKTTTVSLAAAMLQKQGYAVFLGGNIGTPLSEYVLSGRRADVLVLEASSFQLQGCSTFCPRVGVILNISPNHLDHHKDMAEYVEAKFRIFRCQEEGDLAIMGEGLRKLAGAFRLRARQQIFIPADRPPRFADCQLLGAHNNFNVEAAWLACRFFGVSEANAAAAVAAFRPLPHRLERVRRHRGVLYVNDSKCTTVAALKVALESFDQPVRLLCGGKFKGGDLAALAPLVQAKVQEVALFGGSRDVFEKAWGDIVPMHWHEHLKEAVTLLSHTACKGDVVLLAPATSSFDQYGSYIKRGEDFKRIVGALA